MYSVEYYCISVIMYSVEYYCISVITTEHYQLSLNMVVLNSKDQQGNTLLLLKCTQSKQPYNIASVPNTM